MLCLVNDMDPDHPDEPETAGSLRVIERSLRRTIEDFEGMDGEE